MGKRFLNKVCCLLMLILSFMVMLTACNTKIKFKVDFVVDGEVYDTIDTSGQEIIQIPDDPEKEGYIFYGWYWDKDTWEKPFTAKSLLDAPLSENMCVYAKWNIVDSTDPSDPSDPSEPSDPSDPSDPSEPTEPSDPSDPSDPSEPTEPSEPSSDTQAVFTTFEKTGEYEYSLKVSNSKETLALESLVSVNELSSWTLSTDEGGTQTIANKTATLTVGDNTYYVLVKAEDNSTQLYTLKIRRKPMYDVVFDVAGGTSVNAQQVEEGGLAVAPETTREGYDFTAWNYDFTTPITENKTIVASWTVKEYTITYHLNGGQNADNPSVYTIESNQITLVNPTRSDYTFDGWYTSSSFASTSKITAISKGSTGNLNLYAKWTAVTSEDGNEDSESAVDFPGITITQTSSQYVTTNDYSSVSTYAAFTAAATPTYLVPGLNEGLIPQSMDVWEAKDLLLISGYFADAKTNTSGSPSAMIVGINLKTGKHAATYCLKNIDGTNHASHVGGLAVTEKNIFISSGKTLYRIPLSQLETVGNAGTLQIVEEIKVAALGSFCNYSDGVIWVGDFINSTEVPVLPDSSFVCSSYKAWAVGYKVKDTESEFSSENWDPSTMEYATPDYALAITNKVQGLAFVNGKVALSTSYGRNNNAKIYVYNSPLQSEQDASITVNDKDVPVWVLDGTFLDKSYTLMPMSEGLSSYNGKLLVVFESGTKKYYNAKNPTDHIWSVTL